MHSLFYPAPWRSLLLRCCWEPENNIESFRIIQGAHQILFRCHLGHMDLAEKTADTRARKWLGSLYNNIGWTYHDLKDYVRSLTFFEKLLAWRMDQKDERGTFIAKWTVARTYRSQDRIDEALALQRELLDEIQRKGLERLKELGE